MNKDREEQFLEAYDVLADALFRYCYFKTGNRELAKDMLQDIFLKVWQYLQKGNIIDNTKAFLYRMARNSVIDWYRKKKTVSLDMLYEDGFEPKDSSLDTSQKAEAQQALRILSKLDQDDQNLIIWRYVDELSPKEIAVLLDEKENTVSVRLHRALKRFQDIIR